MSEYLGEVEVDVKDTKYKDYTPSDWALLWVEKYGWIDGAHHKNWVLDHVARILKGGKITIKQASWAGGHKEYRFNVEPTRAYYDWVTYLKAGEDGPDTYSYDEGIAP